MGRMEIGAEVDPKVVHGSRQMVMEIVKQEKSGRFRLDGVNLPYSWGHSIDVLRKIAKKRLEETNINVCERWNFSLEKTVLDPNNVIKEMVIRNDNTGSVSKIFLNEKGTYLSKNLDSAEAVMIIQKIMGSYLEYGWGKTFQYGYVLGDPKTGIGFGPWHLEIPRRIIELPGEITNESYQEEFRLRTTTMAKNFGLKLGEELLFNKRGLLRSVSVFGDRSYYSLEEEGQYDNGYHAHNVDSPTEAIFLMTAVASYINDLSRRGL